MGCGGRLVCTSIHLFLVGIMPSVVQEGIVIIIHACRCRRGCNRGYMSSHLKKKEFILFAFGLIGKFLLDKTSSSIASGKDGIHLSLCGLDCRQHVIIRNHVVIDINSKLIFMHIKYYMWDVMVYLN